MEGQTEAPDAPPAPPVEVSEPPFVLTLVLWIGVFSAVTWGMMALFRAGRRGEREDGPDAT